MNPDEYQQNTKTKVSNELNHINFATINSNTPRLDLVDTSLAGLGIGKSGNLHKGEHTFMRSSAQDNTDQMNSTMQTNQADLTYTNAASP